MKTNKEWLAELPAGYRELALANCDAHPLPARAEQVSALSCALCSFYWAHSLEGYEFWGEVYDAVVWEEPLPPLPESRISQLPNAALAESRIADDEHDQAAEEMLHARIQQLEQQLADSETRSAKLENSLRNMIEYNKASNPHKNSLLTEWLFEAKELVDYYRVDDEVDKDMPTTPDMIRVAQLSRELLNQDELIKEQQSRIVSLEQQLAGSEKHRREMMDEAIAAGARVGALTEQLASQTRVRLKTHERANKFCHAISELREKNEEQQSRIAILESALQRIDSDDCAENWMSIATMRRRIAHEALNPEEPAFVLQDDSIESWLCKLPSGYRERALEYYAANTRRHKINPPDSTVAALYRAFRWSGTKEGYMFWEQVALWLNSKDELPELPA